MKLLVKRDKTHLVPCEGEAIIYSYYVPGTLRTVRIIPHKEVMKIGSSSIEGKLVTTERDWESSQKYLSQHSSDRLPALWSGNRSAVVQCEDGELYRIKGVTWNSQELSNYVTHSYVNSVFGRSLGIEIDAELRCLRYFSYALEHRGLSPVMDYVGRWMFYAVDRTCVGASIFRVKGDTRLDELMCAVDTYLDKIVDDCVAARAGKIVRALYKDFGFIAGRLKQLMTTVDMSWGQRLKATNANIGNIVVYRENDLVKLGLVDFDAAATIENKSLSLIRRLQRSEFKKIISTAYDDPTSIRFGPADNFDSLNWSFLDFDIPKRYYRNYFVDGFKLGYNFNAFLPIKDSVDGGRVTELFKLLKDGVRAASKNK